MRFKTMLASLLPILAVTCFAVLQTNSCAAQDANSEIDPGKITVDSLFPYRSESYLSTNRYQPKPIQPRPVQPKPFQPKRFIPSQQQSVPALRSKGPTLVASAPAPALFSRSIQDQDLNRPDEDLEDETKEESSRLELLDIDDDKDELDRDMEELDDIDEPVRRQRPDFGPWPRKGIRGISIDIRDMGPNRPEDRSGQLVNSGGAGWADFAPAQKVFAWAAPNIKYQPLYFEDVALERYGQTARPYQQTVLSGLHFYQSLFLLRKQASQRNPFSCDYPLGFCRPGNTVDYTIQRRIER
jgi:hypothetical protein